MNILIADGGSTKTDWMVLQNGSIAATFTTRGINPTILSDTEIDAACAAALAQDAVFHAAPHAVYYYGAGCIGSRAEVLRHAIARHLPAETAAFEPAHACQDARVFVESDLIGAARALCGHHEGIACILGTGSNSCLWDGARVAAHTPALGYVLGDEGSGTAIGKAFLGGILKGGLPVALRDAYFRETGLDAEHIIYKVYREPAPNRFLASVSAFVGARQHMAPLRDMVRDLLRDFLRKNIAPYRRPDLPLHFVGSIAAHYETLLREAVAAEGRQVGRIVRAPIALLAAYHAADDCAQ